MIDPATLTVFVTGATSGFGEATARRFAAAGAKVIVSGRRARRLDKLVAELGEGAHAVTLDVRDQAAVDAAFAALPAPFDQVSVLVNNAGLALGLEPAQEANMEDWENMVDTNVKGLMYCTRAALPGMVARGRGHVINIGSVAGSYPYPGGNVYGASKAFVHQFSLNLRADLLGTNVRVSCLEPGLAETEFALVRFKGDADKASAPYKGLQPMSGADIAEVVFLIATLDAHLNINRLELMPVAQAFGPFVFARE